MNSASFVVIFLLISLFIEIASYTGFIYIASKITKHETSRRWRASALVGVLSGIAGSTVIVIMLLVIWILKGDVLTILRNLPMLYINSLYLMLGLITIFSMPLTFIVTLGLYFTFWRDGDTLIEKFWKNPKIHYPDNTKPPYF
jgi:predicted membrane metal-binding protein